MQFVQQVVPFAVVALIVGLIAASRLRGRYSWKMPARKPRQRRTTLRAVSTDRMDDELRDLINKR